MKDEALGFEGQYDSALFYLWFQAHLLTTSAPWNHSHWIRTHALYWLQISSLPNALLGSSGVARFCHFLSQCPSSQISNYYPFGSFSSVCSPSFFFSPFGVGILRIGIGMRTVAYVEYALNRCAIADRFPLSAKRAFVSMNMPGHPQALSIFVPSSVYHFRS